jgi:hypothetical protein
MIARRDYGLPDALLGGTVAGAAGAWRQSRCSLKIELVGEARRRDGRADPRFQIGWRCEPRYDALLLKRKPERANLFGVLLRPRPCLVESIHEFRWPGPTFVEQKGHDW